MKKKSLHVCLAILLCILSLKTFSQSKSSATNQDTSGITNLDILKAPSSPASNLLGFATTDIEKPTDVSSLMLSLQSNTSSFTQLPSNYAVDFAPFLLFKTKTDFTTNGKNGLNSTKRWDIFKQTLVTSFAIRSNDTTNSNFDPKSTYGAFGIKFSIVRPKYEKKDSAVLESINANQRRVRDFVLNKTSEHKAKAKIDSTNYALLSKRADSIRNDIKNEFNNECARELEKQTNAPTSDLFKVLQQINAIDKKQIDSAKYALLSKQADGIRKSIKDKFNKAYAQELEKQGNDSTSDLFKVQKRRDTIDKKQMDSILKLPEISSLLDSVSNYAKNFDNTRTGWSLDFAGGTSLDFRNNQFNNSKVYNAGAWLTGGYNGKHLSFLGLLRYLKNPDKIYALDNLPDTLGNISTFDWGGKLLYAADKSKYTFGVEWIHRSVLSSNTIKPSYRLVFNADYAIWQNQKLTFSFGKNFDGTITKSGNLIAALTFLTGFGNKRN
ncbi:MAG: hypothetical protein LBE82_09910 [Chitinophagaceae bacterium]|jgi:Mor family transcriptional regulator|nr:hypothetical protein [Chitinophagaceae bacterium]